METKLVTALVALLLALGGWNLSQTFSISKDMVLVKEKITQIEKTLDKKTFNKNKKKRKRRNKIIK